MYLCALLIAYCSSAVLAAQLRHVDIQAWPLTASAPQALASISYNTTHASITSSSTPSLTSDDSIVRIGYTDPTSKEWSGVATSSTSFQPQKAQTILLHLDGSGHLYHIGFRARDGSQKRGLSAMVIPQSAAPLVQMNKPVVLNSDGQMAAPPEKTFLQKYWWAIAGALVLQVLLSGGGGGEEKK